jgi:LysM repeat protein
MASAADDSAAKPAPYKLHVVDKRDTLMGLSLKYGISADIIRRANDLPTDNLSTMRELRIPLSTDSNVLDPKGSETSKNAMIRRFRVANDLTEAEARAYLSIADWNYEQAQKEFGQGEAFEAASARPGPVASNPANIPASGESDAASDSMPLLSGGSAASTSVLRESATTAAIRRRHPASQ